MPGTFCNVQGCRNNSVTSPDLSFFRIPRDETRMKVWVRRIGREDILTRPRPQSFRVCAVHFSPAMFKIKRLASDAVPTLCLPDSSDKTQSTSIASYLQKCNKETQVNMLIQKKTINMKQPNPTKPTAILVNRATQTEFPNNQCSACKLLPISQNLPQISAKTQAEPMLSEDQMPILYTALTDHNSTKRTKTKLSKNREELTINTTRKLKLKHHLQEKEKKLKNDFKNLANKLNQVKHASTKEYKLLQIKNQDSKIVSKNKTSVLTQIDKMQMLQPRNLLRSEYLINDFFKWQNELKSKYKVKKYQKALRLLALNLYLISPQTYRFLENSFNLPSIKTLQNVKINFRAGVSYDLIRMLSQRLKKCSQNHKYCIICLDEMVLKKNLYYDNYNDEIIGFQDIDGKKQKEIVRNAFVMLLRGCIENYKLPLGYAFTASNKNYTELNNWLDKTIKKLSDSGFVVCAVVSDQSSNFVNLAKSRGVSVEKPYFTVDDKKVFYVFDVPHLQKNICNNLLTCNFLYDENKLACWEHIETFYNRDIKRNARIAPKLTDAHLKPNQIERIKLQHAAQVLSHSVAAGMFCEIELRNLPADAQQTADFISKVNNLFDVLNSSKVSDPNKYKRALFGASYQLECLKSSLETFKNIRAIKISTKEDITYTIEVFTGLQITINSILQLLDYFVSEGVNYFYTKRVSKDAIENLLKVIRQQEGSSHEPTPIQFKRAFSKIVFDSLFRKSPLTSYYEDDLDSFFLLRCNAGLDILFANDISD